MEDIVKEQTKVQSLDTSKDIFRYIVFVRAKYLQMVAAFYIYKNDIARVDAEFVEFNDFFARILDIYQETFGKMLFEREAKETFDIEGKINF